MSALVALIPATYSYLDTIAQPSNSSLGIRTVEWLRDHGARGLVARVESIYYQLTAPAKGGPPYARFRTWATAAARMAMARARRRSRSRPGRRPPTVLRGSRH